MPPHLLYVYDRDSPHRRSESFGRNIVSSITGREFVSILKKAGFLVERHEGSHVFIKHMDGRETVVPVHAGETIVAGFLMNILSDVKMTEKDILKTGKK